MVWWCRIGVLGLADLLKVRIEVARPGATRFRAVSKCGVRERDSALPCHTEYCTGYLTYAEGAWSSKLRLPYLSDWIWLREVWLNAAFDIAAVCTTRLW